MESATCCGMESDHRSVWNQSEGRYTLRVMPYAYGNYILAHARLHTNPSDWIEKRPFENGLFSWLPLLGSNQRQPD